MVNYKIKCFLIKVKILKILNIFFHNNLNTVNIIRFIKILIYKNNALLYIFVKAKNFFVKLKSQSNEYRIITKLIKKYKIYGNFLEIGYSPWEYNFCQLDPRKGIIVDANPLNIKIGRWLNNKSKFICQFLTLNNIKKFIKNINVKIDLLSLDIDGNDYYLMKKLIKLNPKLVACEYNPAFFLRPIIVKYRKYFDRTKISKEWLYYGCSLKGWEIFMKKNKYSMVKISKSGVNAFFIKNDLLKLNDKILTAKKNFIDFKYPFQETHKDQWNKIKHFNFKIIN